MVAVAARESLEEHSTVEMHLVLVPKAAREQPTLQEQPFQMVVVGLVQQGFLALAAVEVALI